MCALLNLSSNNLRDKLACQLAQCACSGLSLDDFCHLLSDGSDLRAGSICGLLDLVWSSLREGDGEKSDQIIVSCLDGNASLDQGLPFSDQRSQLVGCEVKTVEVGQAVLALNLINSQLDLSECVVFVILEIGQGDLEDSSFEGVVCVLETCSSVYEGFANTTQIVNNCMKIEPLDAHTLER